MKVATPFQLNSFIKTIAIPDASFKVNNRMTVAGWGTLSSGGILPSTLMKVTVPFVPFEDCRESYGAQIIAGMLCAGKAGKDSCQGRL